MTGAEARAAAEARLRCDGSSDAAVAALLDAFDRLTGWDTGTLAEADLSR